MSLLCQRTFINLLPESQLYTDFKCFKKKSMTWRVFITKKIWRERRSFALMCPVQPAKTVIPLCLGVPNGG